MRFAAHCTTDPKSKINPATPRLADFVWKRVEVAENSDEAAAKPDIPAVNSAAELMALQGQWKVVRFEQGKEAHFPDARIVLFEGEQCEILPMESDYLIKVFRIDPTKVPRTLDLFGYNSESQMGDRQYLGIYRLDGQHLNICLRRCLPVNGDQRPTSFTIDPDSADASYVLERDRPTPDDKLFQGDWEVLSQIENGQSDFSDILPASNFRFVDHHLVKSYKEVKGRPGGTFVLSTTDKPPRIRLITAEFKLVGKEWVPFNFNMIGIYKFDGDRLTIAFRKDAPTPEKFESTPGSGVTLLELKRSETKPATDAVPAPNDSKAKSEQSEKDAEKPPVKAGDTSEQFGPLIERAVNDMSQTLVGCAIDLDSGKLFSFPEKLVGDTNRDELDRVTKTVEQQTWLRNTASMGSEFSQVVKA